MFQWLVLLPVVLCRAYAGAQPPQSLSNADAFRRATQAQLIQRFLPIVKKATDRVGLAVQRNDLAGRATQFGLVSQEQATIERHVTARALDGLYATIAEQERPFRQNPSGATSDIVRKVFGVLK